jgi:phosphoserine phosphatase
MKLPAFLAALLLLCPTRSPAVDIEPHAARILHELTATRDAVVEAVGAPRPVFMTFWDFDGTMLDGDCSEGLVREGKAVYPGLAQKAIDAGLYGLYSGTNGFALFWRDYRYLDERIGHWLAYPFLLQMLRGARAEAVSALAEEHFGAVLKRYFFAASTDMVAGLREADIEVHVVSASPELFVRGAASFLGIDPEQIHGIRAVPRDGRVTEQLIYPVTWADGKRERIEELLRERQARSPSRRVFVIGGFGNSYNTDGPFLKWIAAQALPGGRPLAVMINGGEEPAEYRGLFYCVKQEALVEE